MTKSSYKIMTTSALCVEDVYRDLLEFAPEGLAESWDRVGLQAGSLKAKVGGILVGLDVTHELLAEAETLGANLVIVHHPLFFRPLERLDEASATARYAREVIQKNLHVLVFHTNLDAARGGLNDVLAKKLGLRQCRPLLADKRHARAGLGRMGFIRSTLLQDFLTLLKTRLSLTQLRYVGDLQQPLRSVAVMTGSGASFVDEAKKKGADALVTGDVKYHHAMDARAEGLALIDIGHYAGEIGMVSLVAERVRRLLTRRRSRLPVFETQVASDPFCVWPAAG